MTERPRIPSLMPLTESSKGIPRQRLAPLGGETLFADTAGSAGHTPAIDREAVSTGDDEIARDAGRRAADDLRRSAELASDKASMARLPGHHRGMKSRPGTKRIPRGRTGVFTLLALALLCLGLEGFALGSLWIIERAIGRVYQDASVSTDSISPRHQAVLRRFLAGESAYYAHSPTLGWTIKPNGAARTYRSNSDGLRADDEYRPTAPYGVRRIAAFGDSFTHADGVENSEAWENVLAAKSPSLEVLNFGVGGYGLDQAFLRYQEEGVAFNPDIVFIGFMPENIKRMVNVFRPFYGEGTGLPLAKPRFFCKNGELSLLRNPMRKLEDYQLLLDQPASELPRLGRHDYFFNVKSARNRYDASALVRFAKMAKFSFKSRLGGNHIIDVGGLYNNRSEAFRVTKAVISEFYHLTQERGSLPAVLIFPAESDLIELRRGRSVRYQPLVEYLDAERMTTIDLRKPFETNGRAYEMDELFDGHYTPLGNRLVADFLFQWLEEEHLLPSTATTTADVESRRQ